MANKEAGLDPGEGKRLRKSGLGARIAIARGSLNQVEFARLLGVSKNSILRYENGHSEPNIGVILDICEATGVALNWLVTGEGSMLPDKRSIYTPAKPSATNVTDVYVPQVDTSEERSMLQEQSPDSSVGPMRHEESSMTKTMRHIHREKIIKDLLIALQLFVDDSENNHFQNTISHEQDMKTLEHIIRKAQDAKNGGWGVQSTGEKLASALVLNRMDWLAEMEYTVAEAIDRIGPEWRVLIPVAERRLREEGGKT